ncbi:MAG: 30S ribosomal protein S13 [Planctomycetota bacterium]|jgi:small subunit ribosomal protein S13
MPRIAGVDVPNEKRVEAALRYIYGIGASMSGRILDEVGVSPDTRARDLTEDELSRINAAIDKGYEVEGQLRRRTQQDVARLKKIGCYRGLRHIRGLPVRGQRTRTNARTRKGKKKTVAGKKSVKSMR